MKINVDASCPKSSTIVDLSGVLCNSFGDIFGSLHDEERGLAVLEAELQVILMGIQIGKRHMASKLILYRSKLLTACLLIVIGVLECKALAGSFSHYQILHAARLSVFCKWPKETKY